MLRQLVTKTALSVLLVVGVLSSTAAAPASASTAGWRYLNTDADSFYEAQIWFDAYGRMTAWGWFDLDRDNFRETFARSTDAGSTIDEVWVGSRYSNSWSTLLVGNTRYDGQNQWSYLGNQIDGPYNTWWASKGFTATFLGGASSSTGTSAGAFNNLMNSIARLNGTVAY